MRVIFGLTVGSLLILFGSLGYAIHNAQGQPMSIFLRMTMLGAGAVLVFASGRVR